jgi:uncharacterized repeat protein (TIGR01451 family)
MITRGMTRACIAIVWAAAGIVHAAAPKVEVDVSVQKEVVVQTPDGTRSVERRPVDVARPGDVLVYTLRARNAGDGPALGTTLDDPLPEGTVLLPDSVESGGSAVHASLDGGNSWGPYPLFVERAGSDGRVEHVPAPADSYTHLRWVLAEPLGPGQDTNVSFKVRIR